MATWPTTTKGLKARISSYRRKLKAELKEFGAYHDGYGKRLWLFQFYFLLGDLDEAATYMAWYASEFAQDVGEEAQLLCWALLLHRMGRDEEATYQLVRAYDRNPVFLNVVAGDDDLPYSIWGEDMMAMRASQVPREVLDAITDDEQAWLATEWDSPRFAEYRMRHLDLSRRLTDERDPKVRGPLLEEQRGLVEAFKPEVGTAAPDKLWLPFSGQRH